MPGLYVNIIMMKGHQYMRFHQSAELLIFPWLSFCWIWHRPTWTFEPSMAKAHNPHPSRRECHDCRPHAPLPCLNIAQLFSGEKPTHATKKALPNCFIEPPLSSPLNNSSSLPSHSFISILNHQSHPFRHSHPSNFRLWLEVHSHWLFVSKYDASMWYRHHSSSNIPGQNEKHLRHDFGTSFTGPQVLLWNYGSTMVFCVGCQGKYKLKETTKKKRRIQPFWRWSIQMCLYISKVAEPLQPLERIDISAGSSSP